MRTAGNDNARQLGMGHPHRNAARAIDNAILLLHSTGSSTTEFFDAVLSDALYGAGSPLDLSKFYIVIPDAIEHGKSSKPSVSHSIPGRLFLATLDPVELPAVLFMRHCVAVGSRIDDDGVIAGAGNGGKRDLADGVLRAGKGIIIHAADVSLPVDAAAIRLHELALLLFERAEKLPRQ